MSDFLQKKEMFQRNNHDTLPYPISLNNVYLYEDHIQLNINFFLLRVQRSPSHGYQR